MKVSYWLIPAEPGKSELARLIDGLAGRFGGPRFTPHLTLCSGTTKSDSPAVILSKVAAEAEPFELATTGLSFTKDFTKTLYITFAKTPILLKLSARLRMAVEGAGADDEFCPHLSLLYATVDQDIQAALARETVVPPSIYFDSLQAVFTGETNNTKSDVDAWRVLAAEGLTV